MKKTPINNPVYQKIRRIVHKDIIKIRIKQKYYKHYEFD
jgi:hypothetical protein